VAPVPPSPLFPDIRWQARQPKFAARPDLPEARRHDEPDHAGLAAAAFPRHAADSRDLLDSAARGESRIRVDSLERRRVPHASVSLDARPGFVEGKSARSGALTWRPACSSRPLPGDPLRRRAGGGRRIRTIGPAHRILRCLSKKDESPKFQPEAVAACFEGKRNPPDIAAGSGFGAGLPLRAWRAFRFRRTAASRISRVPSCRPHDSLRSSCGRAPQRSRSIRTYRNARCEPRRCAAASCVSCRATSPGKHDPAQKN